MLKSLSCYLAFSFISIFAFAQTKPSELIWFGKGGARAIMPENTLRGMYRALDLGVNVIEMDVVISKDKKVLLSSEPYMQSASTRTPEGKDILFKDERKHNIYAMDYAKVRQYDVGSKLVQAFPAQEKFKAYMPLLSSVLDSVDLYAKDKDYAMPDFCIEFRMLPAGDNVFHPAPAAYVDLVMKEIKQRKLEKRVILQAFDVRVLKYIKKTYPKIRVALMVDGKEEVQDHLDKLGFVPDIFSPYFVLVGKSLVDKCHELGMKVIPWTVNTSDKVAYFLSLGVDGLVTDYPNLRTQVEAVLD